MPLRSGVVVGSTGSGRMGAEAAWMDLDGREHGSDCYDSDGRPICGWPERHDDRFVFGALDFARYPPVVASRSAEGDPAKGLHTGLESKIGRSSWLSHLVTALMVAAALAVVATVITIRVADLHLQTVVSGSMRPTISPGDVAVTQAVPVGSLRVGDAIAFYPPGQTLPVLHRIRSLKTTDAGVVVTTRGDANSVDDPWLATIRGSTAYRLVAVVPFIGWLTELQRPAFILAGLLLGLAILLELRKELGGRRKRSRSRTQT